MGDRSQRFEDGVREEITGRARSSRPAYLLSSVPCLPAGEIFSAEEGSCLGVV